MDTGPDKTGLLVRSTGSETNSNIFWTYHETDGQLRMMKRYDAGICSRMQKKRKTTDVVVQLSAGSDRETTQQAKGNGEGQRVVEDVRS